MKLSIQNPMLSRDIKFQGNSIRGARHILSFNSQMDGEPKMKLVKELITSAMNVPKMHPKSVGVIDHVINVAQEENEIHFRNYQIFRQPKNKDANHIELHEIGPRMIMTVSCILEGPFCGEVLYRAPVVKKIPKKTKMDRRRK